METLPPTVHAPQLYPDRARDTRLQRDVALKLLPDVFASDSGRLARFQREAQVLASLNHPNIAAIYGLEESKAAPALVMELVDGPTLAERIGEGPIPLDEVLSIAGQLADALEYAHESAVIHRDLKPTNIKLTPSGRVKVLDFGLAKALGEDAKASTVSNSPTLSLAATQAGIILGTAAYMSPEQAKGKTADRRSRSPVEPPWRSAMPRTTGAEPEEITAQPVPVLEGVMNAPNNGDAQFEFSESGSFVYMPGSSIGADVSIQWMDRDGKTQPLGLKAGNYNNIRFSPDGARMAMDVLEQQFDIFVYEWARDTMTRLTIDPGTDRNPVWTPDGRRITFRSTRDRTPGNLYWQRADGTGNAQRLTESKNVQYPMSWHPSGKFLAFQELRPQTNHDIMILPHGGRRSLRLETRKAGCLSRWALQRSCTGFFTGWTVARVPVE